MYEKIFKKIKKEGLTAEEKDYGLHLLKNFVDSNPIGIPSPWYKKFGQKSFVLLKSPFQNSFFVRKKTLVGALAVLLFISLGESLSLAAKYSLPGDILYPIKIGLNERIESAVTIGLEQKAEIKVKHLDTRLAEAEKLDTANKFDGDRKTEVEIQFKKSIKNTLTHINTLKASGNADNAIKVSSNVETSLQKHKKIVGKILDRTKSESENTKKEKQEDRTGASIQNNTTAESSYSTTSVKFENKAEMKVLESQSLDLENEIDKKTPLFRDIIEKYSF